MTKNIEIHKENPKMKEPKREGLPEKRKHVINVVRRALHDTGVSVSWTLGWRGAMRTILYVRIRHAADMIYKRRVPHATELDDGTLRQIISDLVETFERG